MVRIQKAMMFAGVAASLVLVGCSGTTYGTGVSQEAQTVEDLANILSIQKKRPDIEYTPRSDIIVPENRTLVDPVDTAAVNNDESWPETPQERIARVRAEAEAARGSTAAENEFSRSQKSVRGIAPGEGFQWQEAPIGEGIPNVSCDPTGNAARRCTAGEISKAVRAARAERRSFGKTGYQRRYLTEPPIEYRTPADGAPQGDLGYTDAELKELERIRKQREKEESRRRNG